MAKKSDRTEENIHAVEEALSKTELFIENNSKMITIIVAAIIVVVLGFFGVQRYILEPREVNATTRMFMAEKYFEQDSLRLALNGDGANDGFLAVIDGFGSTKAGNLANYYAGISYLKLGEFENAIDYLNNFDADDELIGPMAIGAIGDAYLELGKQEKAVDNYLDAADAGDNDLIAPQFLMKAGLVYEEMGKNEQAVETYKRIKQDYPKSTEAREMDKYIARAEGKN